MVHSKEDMTKWRSEQLSYFRKYLGKFEQGSTEYKVIKSGIAELERSGL